MLGSLAISRDLRQKKSQGQKKFQEIAKTPTQIPTKSYASKLSCNRK
jgi:hypothetical protein